MIGNKRSQYRWICILPAVLLLSPCLVHPAFCAEETSAKSLPGYYQFFMKAGDMERIKPEIERDKKMESGEFAPVSMNEPILDLKLPDASNKLISLREYVGTKNTVVITGRAWW